MTEILFIMDDISASKFSLLSVWPLPAGQLCRVQNRIRCPTHRGL